ncbi:hypothetical protein AWN76_012545 [Rhodothermaceae bacterium RA]|nr:hypothetical protein AWN76_012545 [Rhodothermaceae bacterium RA]
MALQAEPGVESHRILMASSSPDGWLVTIIVLGAAQGLFLAVLLATKPREVLAHRLLAAAMAVFSLDLLGTIYHVKGYDVAYPQFVGFAIPLALLLGPLLYLYAQVLIAGPRALRGPALGHFVPFGLVVLLLIPFYAQSPAEKLAFVLDPAGHAWTPPLAWIGHGKFLHGLIYLGLILHLLQRHRRRRRALPTTADGIDLTWLRNMMMGGSLITLIALGLHLWTLVAPVPPERLNPIEGYGDYVALGVTVFFYAIGYLGLRQESIGPAAPSTSDEASTGDDTADDTARPRYAKSGMDPETARALSRQLQQLMETDRPYRRSDLTLHDLAEALDLSPHNLSEVINTQLGQNFYDFVNGYRVREVQTRLADPASAHLTLLALGLEAGFNSKSSFNAAFKKHTGMTPSQFRKQVLRKPV